MTANQSIGEDAAVFLRICPFGNLDGTYKNLIVSSDQFEAEDSGVDG